uniref:Uncharacterized protein n=1 Tax=Phanerochaete carnosa TaxID=231932 RepID=A0A895KWE6_9APHY|nr:hypothetical protein K8K84_mgp037 [Phanerochaete carnosa]QRZ60415.1 hypothetical protein [Phanerochaete carnosa]
MWRLKGGNPKLSRSTKILWAIIAFVGWSVVPISSNLNIQMKNNIKENMLTLKTLKAELEQLKTKNKVDISQSTSTDSQGKPKITTTLYSRGSLGLLWLITFIIGYASKIPVISKIISALRLWYGRTTWWQMLVQLRKAFTIFNAIIGLLVMLKAIGFGSEGIIASVWLLCASYYEMFKSMLGRAFNWLLGLFNLSITPKPKGLWPTWFSKNLSRADPSIFHFPHLPTVNVFNPFKQHEHLDVNKLMGDIRAKEYLLNPFSTTTTSDSWIPSWLWYGGIAIIGVGVAYLGYKLWTNPFDVLDFINPNKSGRKTPSTGTGPDIKLNDATTGAAEASTSAAGAAGGLGDAAESLGFTPIGMLRYVGGSILGLNRTVTSWLNPFNYVTTSDEKNNQFTDFMQRQNTLNGNQRYDLYPFTIDNPYDSGFTRFR